MSAGRSVVVSQALSRAEAFRIFILPPLLTFALIAFSLLLFTSHLAHKDLQTTFVAASARHAAGAVLGHD